MTTELAERPPVLLTPAQVAREYLQCSRSKIYELLARGEIPGAMRVGGSVRISRAAVEAWIRRETGAPSAA